MWACIAQKQDGLSYVGATILNGRLTADQMFALASLSERFGDGHLRTTIGQNILIVNVPNAKTQELVKELTGLGLEVRADGVLPRRDGVHGHGVLQAGDCGDEGVSTSGW